VKSTSMKLILREGASSGKVEQQRCQETALSRMIMV